jgi:hypothetical protein
MATKIWPAIEAIPTAGATRKHWEVMSGADWSALSPLLRATGLEAETIPCFKVQPGGCIRRIVRHSDDNIRAACSEPGGLCKSEKLTAAEVELLALDRVRLVQALGQALGLDGANTPRSDQRVLHVGTHNVSAGKGFPVFLVLGGTQLEDAASIFAEVERAVGPKVVLTPTAQGLGDHAKAYLDKLGATQMHLDMLVGTDSAAKLVPLSPPEQLFAEIRNRLADEPDTAPWRLPPSAKWEEVAINFISDDKITVSHKGQTRTFDASELDMMDRRKKLPDTQWELLKVIACNRGRIPLPAPGSARKSKESLSRKLSAAFGIQSDPIKASKGEYVASYVTNADGLKQGRQGAHQRNFVDDD